MKTPQIDDFPLLVEQLGKARTDRIRYHQKGTGKRQPAAVNIDNDLQEQMLELEYNNRTQDIDDLLTCAAITVKDDPVPLNTHRLRVLFQALPVINTRQIQLLTGLGERQARYYMKAAKFVKPMLNKHFRKGTQT